MLIKSYNDINGQKIVDKLCEYYRDIDIILGLPIHGLPYSKEKYHNQKDGKTIWYISKYFRNVSALQYMESFINRLDTLWIAIEYFQGNISVKRVVGNELTATYQAKLFYALIADSFRSSLDILAKFSVYFFDLNNKENSGFNYKQLILPLKSISESISENFNRLYILKEYKFLKNYRDIEKHVGVDSYGVNFSSNNKCFSIKMNRPEIVDPKQFEESICTCISELLYLIESLTIALKKYPLGYDSPNDFLAELRSDGYYYGL